MSLLKAIEHGKEWRKPYTGGKAISKRCRNHGGCDWCLGNRMYRANKNDEAADEREREYEGGDEI